MRLNRTAALDPEELEALVERYSSIPVGTTLRVSGHPRELFGATKRVLEVESLTLIDDSKEEIRFRQHVIKCRQEKYSRRFRLAEEWPDGVAESGSSMKLDNKVNPTGGLTKEPGSPSKVSLAGSIMYH